MGERLIELIKKLRTLKFPITKQVILTLATEIHQKIIEGQEKKDE